MAIVCHFAFMTLAQDGADGCEKTGKRSGPSRYF